MLLFFLFRRIYKAYNEERCNVSSSGRALVKTRDAGSNPDRSFLFIFSFRNFYKAYNETIVHFIGGYTNETYLL